MTTRSALLLTAWNNTGSAWVTPITGVLSVVPSAYWTGAPIATCQ
jgi:hypothetical protein